MADITTTSPLETGTGKVEDPAASVAPTTPTPSPTAPVQETSRLNNEQYDLLIDNANTPEGITALKALNMTELNEWYQRVNARKMGQPGTPEFGQRSQGRKDLIQLEAAGRKVGEPVKQSNTVAETLAPKEPDYTHPFLPWDTPEGEGWDWSRAGRLAMNVAKSPSNITWGLGTLAARPVMAAGHGVAAAATYPFDFEGSLEHLQKSEDLILDNLADVQHMVKYIYEGALELPVKAAAHEVRQAFTTEDQGKNEAMDSWLLMAETDPVGLALAAATPAMIVKGGMGRKGAKSKALVNETRKVMENERTRYFPDAIHHIEYVRRNIETLAARRGLIREHLRKEFLDDTPNAGRDAPLPTAKRVVPGEVDVRTSNKMKTGEAHPLTKLYLQLDLMYPNMNRTAIKQMVELNGGVEWAIDQIATYRAANGHSTTPVTWPRGRYAPTELPRLMAQADRLEKIYRAERKAGDPQTPITLAEEYRINRGGAVEIYDGGYGKPARILRHHGRGGREVLQPENQGKGQAGREVERVDKAERVYYYDEGAKVEARFRKTPYDEVFAPEERISTLADARRPYHEPRKVEGSNVMETYDVGLETTRAEKIHAEEGKFSLTEEGVVQGYTPQRTLGSMVNEIFDSTVKQGGTTFNLIKQKAHAIKDGGYAVAVRGRTLKVTLDNFTKEMVDKWIRENKDILGDENLHVGAWVTEEALTSGGPKVKMVYIEPSQVLSSKAIATKLARQRGQRAIWNFKSSQEVKIRLKTNRVLPKQERTNLEKEVGMETANEIREGVADALEIDANSVEASTWIGTFGEAFGRAARATLDITRPAGAGAHRLAPAIAAYGDLYASVKLGAQMRGYFFNRNLTKILADGGTPLGAQTLLNKEQFRRYLHHEQAEGVRLRNAAEDANYNAARQRQLAGEKTLEGDRKLLRDGPQKHPDGDLPTLTPEELKAVTENPQIMEAVEYWREKINPFFERENTMAGVKVNMETPSGLYVKISWIDDPKAIPKDAIVIYPSEGPGAGIAPGKVTTRARSAMRREGVAPQGRILQTDLRMMLHDTLMDKMGAAARRRFQGALDTVSKEVVGQLEALNIEPRNGLKVMYRGKKTTLKSTEMVTRLPDGTPLENRIFLPRELANYYDLLAQRTGRRSIPLIDTLSNLVTMSVLLVPAEATIHGLGAIMGAAQFPGWSTKGGLIGMTEHATMVGRMSHMMAKIWDLHGADFARDIQTLSDLGGLRAAHFEKGFVQEGRWKVATKIAEAAENIPLAGQIIKYPKEMVFGMPKIGSKDLNGLETRIRVGLLRAMRNMEPGITDVQAVRQINNYLGTYVSKLEPQLVTLMKPVDTFARAGMSLTKGGAHALINTIPGATSILRNMTGYKGIGGWRTQAMTHSTLLANLYLTKMLDGMRTDDRHMADGTILKPGDPGRWAWDIPGLKLGDVPLPLSQGGNAVIPLRLILNPLHRGLRLTGLSNVYDSFVKGQIDEGDLVDAWATGIGNFALGRMGPPMRAGVTAATGLLPFQTSMGSFLPAYPHKTNEWELSQNIKMAIKQSIPMWKKTYEVWGEAHNKAGPLTVGGKVAHNAAKLFGFELKFNPAGYEQRAIGAGPRMDARRMRDAMSAVVYNYKFVPEEDRKEWLIKTIEERFNPDEVPFAARTIVNIIHSLPRSYTKGQVERALKDAGFEEAHVLF